MPNQHPTNTQPTTPWLHVVHDNALATPTLWLHLPHQDNVKYKVGDILRDAFKYMGGEAFKGAEQHVMPHSELVDAEGHLRRRCVACCWVCLCGGTGHRLLLGVFVLRHCPVVTGCVVAFIHVVLRQRPPVGCFISTSTLPAQCVILSYPAMVTYIPCGYKTTTSSRAHPQPPSFPPPCALFCSQVGAGGRPPPSAVWGRPHHPHGHHCQRPQQCTHRTQQQQRPSQQGDGATGPPAVSARI